MVTTYGVISFTLAAILLADSTAGLVVAVLTPLLDVCTLTCTILFTGSLITTEESSVLSISTSFLYFTL